MPRLQVNLTEAQKREPVPEDTYEARVLEITGPHKGEKSHYVTIKYAITGGEFENRQIWENRPITGKGAGLFAEFWAKVTGEELTYGEEGIDVDTDDAVGQEVSIVVVNEEYPEGSGEFQNRIKKLISA